MNREAQYRDYEIGSYTYGTPSVLDWSQGSTLKVGRYCSFAGGVTIMLGGQHRPDWVTTYPFNQLFRNARSFRGTPTTKGDVVIGNDVWIATEAMILSGVRIGDGAVISARSVVTRDVPPYAIVAGAPAKVTRFRFSDDQIASLLAIAWWNWPMSKVEAAWPLLLSDDVSEFIARYGT